MTELLCVVDENDKVLGSQRRGKVHSSKAWHRGVHILLENEKGEIALQKRAHSKDKFPDKWDVSVSEHLLFGENYLQAAKRGLREEFGASAKLEEALYFRARYGRHDFMVNKLFYCKHDGWLSKNKEMSKIAFLGKKELLEKLQKTPEKFASWAREILNYYFGKPNNLVALKN
ncbi:MAG: NUDIX domain-containing protein [Candidatus Micrarchaeia archaeon]